jgi:hypothetical protein
MVVWSGVTAVAVGVLGCTLGAIWNRERLFIAGMAAMAIGAVMVYSNAMYF